MEMQFYRNWIYRRWVREQAKNPSPSVGVYWHLHHDLICEWCHSYEDRAYDIIYYKPWWQIRRRLKLFQPVKQVSKLPETFRLRMEDEGLRRRPYRCVRGYELKLAALHDKECPDCPWNGKTIFPHSKRWR